MHAAELAHRDDERLVEQRPPLRMARRRGLEIADDIGEREIELADHGRA